MTKLEVGGESECLRHGDVSPRLEHHHRDGAAGEGVTDDQLGDNAVKEVSENRSASGGRVKGLALGQSVDL